MESTGVVSHITIGWISQSWFRSFREWALSGAFDRREGILSIHGQILGLYVEIYWSNH